MANSTDKAPDFITVEFLNASGTPVRLIDLGSAFLTANGITSVDPVSPFRVAVSKKISKAGNAFYDYSQSSIPLPDGLSSFIKVEGVVIPMGRTRPSQKGYPTREGSAQVIIGEVVYTVTAFITENRSSLWVKVIAHKTPGRSTNIPKGPMLPRGGKIVT